MMCLSRKDILVMIVGKLSEAAKYLKEIEWNVTSLDVDIIATKCRAELLSMKIAEGKVEESEPNEDLDIG